jgi:hypothetical protein
MPDHAAWAIGPIFLLISLREEAPETIVEATYYMCIYIYICTFMCPGIFPRDFSQVFIYITGICPRPELCGQRCAD